MFSKILIANRGEIALRIIRACRELGIQTVVVYSDGRPGRRVPQARRPGDLHRRRRRPPRATSTSPASSAPPRSPTWRRSIPGYGFLAENAHFAEVCRGCKIEFIGPPVEAMARRRRQGRVQASSRRRPRCRPFPAATARSTTRRSALKIAHEIGYPVIIKAAAGGGGRGMRVAHNDVSLQAGLPAGAGRGRERRSRTRRSTSKSTSSSAGTSRCRSSPTITATPSTSGSATARCSAGTRSSSKNRRRPCLTPRAPRSDCATPPCG